MVNFKENYKFSRFLRGSNIFWGWGGIQLFPGGGGVQLLVPYRKYITCDFPGEVRIPCPPPPSLWIRTRDCPWYYHASNLTYRYLCMFLEGQVDRQTDRQKGAQTANAKTISLRLHRGEASTEHRIFSVKFKNTTQCFR